MLLRRELAVAAFVLVASSCDLVPDDAADPARGIGVADALHVLANGVALAETVAARPPPACRAPLPPSGPLAVATALTWTRKAPAVPDERLVETVRWQRDADGDIAAERVLELRLPDGRLTRRTREDRTVSGGAYAAIDGRFAVADRIPDIGERTVGAAFGDVDALLSLVTLGEGGSLVAAADRGLCGLRDPALRLPPVDAAALELGARSRSGWLRWDDAESGSRLVVTFDERVRSFDGDVVAPDRTWEVDPDRTWHTVTRFVADGRQAGWLRLPRLQDVADPEPATGPIVDPQGP